MKTSVNIRGGVKSEGRIPKPERNPNSEFRKGGRPTRAVISGFRLRISFGFRPSTFGFHHRPQSAFTLIELVISASLMALILASGYLCLHSALASQRMVDARAETAQRARVALATLAADLRAACALSKEIQFLGMDRTLDGVEADNLDFATHHYTPRRAREGDYCQLSYFVAKEPASGKLALWRRRNPAFGLDPLAGGQREELIEGLRGLRFEYCDGIVWYDEWGDPEGKGKAENSARPRYNVSGFPEAVRITLWLEPPPVSRAKDGDPDPPMVFQTIARLNLTRADQAGEGGGSSRTVEGRRAPDAAEGGTP